MLKIKTEPETFNDDNNSVDRNESDLDLLRKEELEQYFNIKCDLVSEYDSLSNSYILHIDGTINTTPNLVVGLSNYSTEIYHIGGSQIAKTCTLEQYKSPVVGVKFQPDNNNLVYTGVYNGHINLWDIRTPQKPVNDFTIDNKYKKNPFLLCFDISSNNTMICAGSELIDSDAFLLFWDIRSSNLLGGYWESHTEDITQVQFHPNDSDKLLSGSTDGLINVYDISQDSEEDALIETLNTELSIEHLRWHYYNNNKYIISCITPTSLQIWKTDDAEPFAHIEREKVAETIKRKSGDCCYIVGPHTNQNNDLFVLAGCNYKQAECLRSIVMKNNDFHPAFQLSENKQLVRTSWFNSNSNLLVTGGEKGLINVWKVSPFNLEQIIKKEKI